MNCPICGTQIPEGADFCPKCSPARPEPEADAAPAPYAPDPGSLQDAGKVQNGPAAPETDAKTPADAGFFGEPEQPAPAAGADAGAYNDSRVPPNGDHGFPPPPPGEGYPGAPKAPYGQTPAGAQMPPYGQPPAGAYMPPPYGFAPQEPEAAKNAQILSIVGLSLSALGNMNVLSLVLCIIGLRKAKESRQLTGGEYCPSAKTASICGLIGIVLSVIKIVAVAFFLIFYFSLFFSMLKTVAGAEGLPDLFSSFRDNLMILFF